MLVSLALAVRLEIDQQDRIAGREQEPGAPQHGAAIGPDPVEQQDAASGEVISGNPAHETMARAAAQRHPFEREVRRWRTD